MNNVISYDLKGAARETGLSTAHFERAIKSGDLPARRSSVNDRGEPTGKYLIKAADLKAYIEGLPAA